MAYGVKYICEFDSIAEESYKVELLLKDYVGGSTAVVGSSVPIVHSWDNDDPRTPIKGSSLKINLINEDNSLPLSTFYSINDDEWQVKFYWGEQLLFIGFLVQDDCQELEVDYTHEISLSATDNLGLLKDTPLIFGIERVYLVDVVRQCLITTGLELTTNYFTNIQESYVLDYDTPFLEQVLIDTRTLLKSDTEFESCYEALTRILGRFNLTLVQAFGEWYIIRWDEARYFLNEIEGFINVFGFEEIWTPTTLDQTFQAGLDLDTYAEAGLSSRIQRPIKYAKEQFDYIQPEELLLNANLQTLGALVTSYAVGDLTYFEYEMPHWGNGFAAPFPTRRIRVIKDVLGNEVDRYAILFGPTGDNPGSASGTSIPAVKGDTVLFTFSFKTVASQAGPGNFQIRFRLSDGITTRYFNDTGGGTWTAGLGFTYSIANGDNTNVWHTATIEAKNIPFDGYITPYLPDVTSTDDTETQIKDIRFQYISYVNESTKIIGHTHKTSQDFNIKNTNERTIFFDDAPRKSIKGAMFLNINEVNGLKLTSQWRNKTNDILEDEKLGAIITYENLYYRNRPRTILEGSFRGLVQDSKHISALSIIQYVGKVGLNFIYGHMDIDYRNNSVNGTLYELYTDTDDDSDLDSEYEFNFLYDTK